MNRIVVLLILVFALSGLASCGPKIPTACEEENKKDQERCEEAALAATLVLFQNRSAAAPAPVSPGVNFVEESAFQLNGTFAVAQTLPLPTASTIQSISGRINTESDVDIYVLSYMSGEAPAFVMDASKPGTPSVCALYTRFGVSALDSAVPDGSLISVGALTASSTPVVLDRISRTHLYIRCSGVLNETYTVRLAYSTMNKP